MSHRIYLHNISQPGENDGGQVTIVEAGYELPLFLQPLLLENGMDDGNNSRIYIDEDHSGLFYAAAAGIKNLKRFYNFLEKHQDKLVKRPEEFKIAKQNLFDYLDNLNQPYFYLDAWDIFSVDGRNYEEQAQELLEQIRVNNSLLTDAMDADDSSQIVLSHFAGDTGIGFKSFKPLLNHKTYNYGWSLIINPDSADATIFKENGLYGLKDGNGSVLIPCCYDKFDDFNDDGIALVSMAGKFGYVNARGREIITPQFDQACGFAKGYAVVFKLGKYGLINDEGKLMIGYQYDKLQDIIMEGRSFAAKLNDKWGVVDINNEVLIPFEHEEEILSHDEGASYIIGQKNKKEKLIYTSRFVFLTADDDRLINITIIPEVPYESYVYEVPGAEGNNLYNDKGALLLSNYEEITLRRDYVFVIKKNGKYGVIGYKGNLLLDFEYDAIDQVFVQLDDELKEATKVVPAGEKEEEFYFFNIEKDKKYALFVCTYNFSRLVTEFIYEEIACLDNSLLAVKKDGLWGVIDAFGKVLSPVIYDLFLKTNDEQDAVYMFKGVMIYFITPDGTEEADPEIIQEYIEANEDYPEYFDSDIEEKLQAYIDRETPLEEVLFDSAIIILQKDKPKKSELEKAKKDLEQAADLGYAPAMNGLGFFYEDADNRCPEHKNLETAFHYFLKAAQGGLEIGMYNLALCYAEGTGTPVDTQQMVHWYKLAFDAGNESAALKLANYYYLTKEKDQSNKLALWYFEIANAAGEDVDSELAWLYDHFNESKKAMPYLLKAAADENAYAHWQLGTYAKRGIEMKVNIPLAINYYQKAITLGFSVANQELYDIYTSVNGYKDPKLAQECKDRAIEAGFIIEEKKEGFLDRVVNMFSTKYRK